MSRRRRADEREVAPLESLNDPLAWNSVGDRTIVTATPMMKFRRRPHHGLMRDHDDGYGRALARDFTFEVYVADSTLPSTT